MQMVSCAECCLTALLRQIVHMKVSKWCSHSHLDGIYVSRHKQSADLKSSSCDKFLLSFVFFRSLLILDDIWDSTVLKVFDIQCRVLLTTRNRSLTDSVSGMCFVAFLWSLYRLKWVKLLRLLFCILKNTLY